MNCKFLMLLSLMLACGCNDKPKDDDAKAQPEQEKHAAYEFGNLQDAALRADASKIHSVTCSKEGMVYIAGQKTDDTLVLDRTDGATWWQLDLDNGTTPDGMGVYDLSSNGEDAKISITASLKKGVIVFEKSKEILMIFDDDTTYPGLAWDLDNAGFVYGPDAFLEMEKDGKSFIYAAVPSKVANKMSPINSLRMFELGKKSNLWQGGYLKHDKSKLDNYIESLCLGMNGSLLLGTYFKGMILEVPNDALGNAVADKRRIAKSEIAKDQDLWHGGVENGTIKQMLLMDNKYLLVGFAKKEDNNKAEIPNTGGLFYKDMSDTLASWKNAGVDYTVFGIIADVKNPKRAVIATNLGAMIFEDGEILEIAGQKMLSKAVIDSNRDKLFSGTVLDSNFTSVAQDKDGKFYFATNNGVATMVIKPKS